MILERDSFRRSGVNSVELQYIHIKPESISNEEKGNDEIIVFLTGWNETFLKYEPFLMELSNAGFEVFSYDHQSQGISSRVLERKVGYTYVHRFEDYVNDLICFITQVVQKERKIPVNVIAHSMGGLITGMASIQMPHLFNRIVLSAPMFEFKTAPFPPFFAKYLSQFMVSLGLGQLLAPGAQEDSDPQVPVSKKYSHSTKNLDKWNKLRKTEPIIVMKGVTYAWVRTAFLAQEWFRQRMDCVKVPYLLFQADDDVFVRNEPHDEFCARAACSSIIKFENCYHEILMEEDRIRNRAVNATIEFLRHGTVTQPSAISVQKKSILKTYLKIFILASMGVYCFSTIKTKRNISTLSL